MVLTESSSFGACVNMLEPFNSTVLDVKGVDELTVHQERSSSEDGNNRKFADPAVRWGSSGSDPRHKKDQMQVVLDWRRFNATRYWIILLDNLKVLSTNNGYFKPFLN